MKIIITRQDVLDNPIYEDPGTCPAARVLQRTLNDPDISMVWDMVSSKRKEIGKLKDMFTYKEFNALKEGKIQKFVTEYTPI